MSRATVVTPASRLFQLRNTLVPWVLLAIVLTLSCLCIDFLVSGPVSSWFLEVALIQPVQAQYGFSAEWRPVGRSTQLVVTSVEPTGVFARAGIKPGFAFPFIGCGNFYYDGAWYRVLACGPEKLRLETAPGQPASARVFHLPQRT